VPPVHSLSPSSVATAPAPLSPLSLHDALPISRPRGRGTLNRFPLPTTRLPIQGPSADRIVVCIPFLCTRENSYSSSALSHAAKGWGDPILLPCPGTCGSQHGSGGGYGTQRAGIPARARRRYLHSLPARSL